MAFQFLQCHRRQHFGIKLAVGQAEAAAEGLPIQRGKSVSAQHHIGRLNHRTEVIHQRAGPVENEILKHGGVA